MSAFPNIGHIETLGFDFHNIFNIHLKQFSATAVMETASYKDSLATPRFFPSMPSTNPFRYFRTQNTFDLAAR